MYKRRKIILIWLSVLVVSIGWLGTNFAQSKKEQENLLELNVFTSKTNYILGEQVDLQTSIKNIGKHKTVINHLLTIESGYIQVFIAKDDGVFGRYLGPGWGIDERMVQYTLKPGESVKDSSNLLWNQAPSVSHLNKKAAKQAQKGRVTTAYAFDKSGSYKIKLRLVLSKDVFESNEITIIVNEPEGDNLKIWNVIKDKPDIGFFIQKGSPRNHSPRERIWIKTSIDNLLLQYPNGKIANSLKKSLATFRKQN